MMKKSEASNSNDSFNAVWKLLIFVLIAVITGLALSIPFTYESMTLWYKIGIDKTLLRAGKIAGLLAALAIFLQIFAAVRPKPLIQLFGLAQIMRFHRANGLLIFLLAFSHVSLVVAPEGFNNLPFGAKHWPEMVGASLLTCICIIFFSSQFREKLHIAYTNWRSIHKPLGYCALVLMLVHIRFVSDSFDNLVPQIGLYLLTGSVSTVILVVKLSNKA